MNLYSHSQLGSYENCPRQYAFRYIEKPDIVKPETIEAYLGSRVHEALEKLYQDVEMERTPKWEETVGYYEHVWEREWSDRVTIVRGEYTPEDYKNVGRRCLQEYFVRYFPFRDGKVIGLEKLIHIDLSPGNGDGYRLRGVIDRLVDLGNGEYEIHDYKTSREVPEQQKLDNDRQLALYQIGVQAAYPDVQKVHLIWHYVRQDREVRSHRTPDQLECLKGQIIALIDEIEAKRRQKEFPPQESALCDWCEYYAVCPTKKHLVATRELSATQFSADQGVILADKFIEAKHRLEEADAAVQTARHVLLDFALQKGVTVVRGHDAKVRISQPTIVRLPSRKDDPDTLAHLEYLVHSSGKWNEVSELWDKKLREAVEGDLFSPSIKKQIISLLRVSSEPRVSIARLAYRELGDDER